MTGVVALLAELGFPAVVTIAGLAVLILAAACWVIASGERSARVSGIVTRIILARRGDARCLQRADAAEAAEPPVPAEAPPG